MSLLLRRAARIATLQAPGGATARAGGAMSELGLIEDASVLIEGDRVAWVGPDAQLTAERVGEAEEIDCRGKAIVPAFVDSHTHLVWGGDRKDEMEMRLAGADYEAIFAAGGGIHSSVRQTRAATEDELFSAALARALRMRQAGTTTIEIKSGYGLELETELRQLRAAARLRDVGFRIRTTCLAAHAIPPEVADDPAARTAFIATITDEILPSVVEQGLADYADVFCERGVFTPDETRTILGKAKALGLGVRVHANEFGSTGGAMVAAELGAASADHLLVLEPEERRALREAGVVATLLPGTSLVLAKPFADGRGMIDDGLAVAVATDCNPGSCPLESLSVVMGLAAHGCRLSPAEALCAVTHNAAAALGLADTVGRVEAGLDADLLVLATDDLRDLVYHAGSPLIAEVVARGQLVG